MIGQDLGDQGERYVLDLLRAAGLDANKDGPGDILVTSSGIPIEVKAARLTRRTDRPSWRYTFSLYREQDGQVKTDCRKSDLVVLLAYTDDKSEPQIYAIPTSRLGNRRQVALPANLDAYAGLWADYAGWDKALAELQARRGQRADSRRPVASWSGTLVVERMS